MAIKRYNDDILNDPIKRQKLQQLNNLLKSDTRLDTRNININTLQFNNPSLHNIPKDIVPIIQQPYQVNDFFTDLNYSNIKLTKLNDKAGKISNIFPPPLPPPIPNNYTDDNGVQQKGIMIPFIYPTPPILKSDKYNVIRRRTSQPKGEANDTQKKVVKRGRPKKEPKETIQYDKENKLNMNITKTKDEIQIQYDDDTTHDTDEEDCEKVQRIEEMIELAPLPFPPKGYMPFPLNAQLSTLTPRDLFSDLLDAADLVPRIDMVVASAAGTLNDLKRQSLQERFSTSEFDRLQSINEEPYSNDTINYYEGINITNKVDEYNIMPINDLDNHPIYPQITAIVSDIGNQPDMLMRCKIKSIIPGKEVCGIEDNMSHVDPLPVVKSTMSNKEFSSSSKEMKRIEVKKVIDKMEKVVESRKADLYHHKKQELLTKIHNLRHLKINLKCSDIKDKELMEYDENLGIDKDLELMKLRIWQNYEYLRLSSNFYNDSNKVYRKFNSLTLNKLLKLQNYLDYQKKQFEKILNDDKVLDNLVDLSNKDVNKIFRETSERAYGHDLKRILKDLLNNQDVSGMLDSLRYNEFNVSPSSTPEPMNRSNDPPQDDHKNKKIATHFVEDITDFLTLTSLKDFDLITGNNQKFKKDNKFNNIKHKLFQDPLYETSGSDMNSYGTAGFSTAGEEGGPKRRGRRSLEVNENNLHSESYLLAKISKNFVGPQPVDDNELAQDFNAIGIQSHWNY